MKVLGLRVLFAGLAVAAIGLWMTTLDYLMHFKWLPEAWWRWFNHDGGLAILGVLIAITGGYIAARHWTKQ